MRVREAKDFLVQQLVEQASLEHVPLSDLEKRMMYFTETGDCPEDPVALNDVFEVQYDSTTYEKKISRLMAQAYRRIRREKPERMSLWNEAVHTLRKGDHYILMFLPQRMLGKSARLWSTYILVALAGASLYLLVIFFFGNRGTARRGEPAPADKYFSAFSPPVQHILQTLFLLAVTLALFPQLLFKLNALFQRCIQSISAGRRR